MDKRFYFLYPSIVITITKYDINKRHQNSRLRCDEFWWCHIHVTPGHGQRSQPAVKIRLWLVPSVRIQIFGLCLKYKDGLGWQALFSLCSFFLGTPPQRSRINWTKRKTTKGCESNEGVRSNFVAFLLTYFVHVLSLVTCNQLNTTLSSSLSPNTEMIVFRLHSRNRNWDRNFLRQKLAM